MNTKAFFLFFSWLFSLLISLGAQAGGQVIYVDGNAVDTGSNDGSSWATAFITLQDALAVAVADDDIWVAQGVYYPDEGSGQADNDPLSTFKLVANVDIYGGFVGTETLLEQRDINQYVTILSGDLNQDDVNTDGNHVAETVADIQGINAYHVMDNNVDAGFQLVLDGMTITAGHANGPNQHSVGGGLRCAGFDFSPIIRHMQFIGNQASAFGAAMSNCHVDIADSTFLNNVSVDSGGALTILGGVIERSVFQGNQCTVEGGAIFNVGNPLIINLSTFTGNQSLTSDGGAINSNGQTLIESSLFSGNQAVNGGAFSTYVINLARGSNHQFHNVTFTGNAASQSGGAISVQDSKTIDLTNTIIWNNLDSSGLGTASASIHIPNSTLTQSFSLVQGYGTAGVGNLDQDPMFVTATDPTQAPTLAGNPRPNFNSPVFNVGDNTAATVLIDLDGEPRVQDTTIDLGAFEGFNDLIFADGFDG